MKTCPSHDVIGLREWIALPDLGLAHLRAKIDTGARTSALHATDIVEFERDGHTWVRFNAWFGNIAQPCKKACEAPVIDCKRIKSSTGHVQERYVIRTSLVLGQQCWPVEFTLTCRKTMRYRVLLGSRALIDGHWLVDPAQRYLQAKPDLSSVVTGV